jgi:hypothetical protein
MRAWMVASNSRKGAIRARMVAIGEIVRLLLDHGAESSLKDYAERDARSLAMARTRPDLAQLFD